MKQKIIEDKWMINKFFMKSFYIKYSCIYLLLFGISCGDRDINSVSESSQEVEVNLDAGSFHTVETRSRGVAPDVDLKNIYARTISASGSVLQDNINVTNLYWNGNNKYRAVMTVNDPSKVSKICLLANCSPDEHKLAVVNGNIQVSFKPCTASGLTAGIPMWGVAPWTKGTSLHAQLTRSISAAMFISKVTNSTFQLQKYSVHNVTDKVNLCSSDWTSEATTAEPAGMLEHVSNNNEAVFFSEFKEMDDKSKRTCFVLEATYNGIPTFYRIDFYKNGEYFLPKRNSKYIFNILEVSQKGYETKEEALKNVGANVQKKILIDIEDNSNEIATDGTYRFSFGRINTAILNPKNFLITTFETDNNVTVQISQPETGKNWLSNLQVKSTGTEEKKITGSNGEEKTITIYKWEIYGDFANCDQLKTESSIWGRRTQNVKLTCGHFEKMIGVTQSLMPLAFINYKEYVKGDNDKEIEVNTLEYDLMDLTKVKNRYYRGLDLRPNSHKLRVWLKWDACSPMQSLPSTELTFHIKTWKRNKTGNTYNLTEITKKVSNFDGNKNGKVYLDIEMPEVEIYEEWCKNWVEITASIGSSIDTKLYVEQRYIQDYDNAVPIFINKQLE